MFYLLFLKMAVVSQFDLEKPLRQHAEFQKKALKRREPCLPGRWNDGQGLCVCDSTICVTQTGNMELKCFLDPPACRFRSK